MSKADEMFEELGFKKVIDNDKEIKRLIGERKKEEIIQFIKEI